MSEYIDKQALCDDLREYKVHPIPISSDESEVKGYNDGIDLAISVIAKFPSAETEQKIIYCKDCKFAHLTIKGEVKYCDVWFPETKTYLSGDDFCSSAEKIGE